MGVVLPNWFFHQRSEAAWNKVLGAWNYDFALNWSFPSRPTKNLLQVLHEILVVP